MLNGGVASESPLEPAPLAAADVRQLTLRTVLAGMVIGGVLSLCNIYSGLKIGFTTNMSIASALLAYGGFHALRRVVTISPFELHENTINQTTASAAASIAGAGLVAPIPALTMLTGRELDLGWLVAWTLSVSLLGVWVGIGVRRQMLITYNLPFPYGMATATTMREMYATGRAAALRVRWLIGSALAAASFKGAVELLKLPVAWLPGNLRAASTTGSISFKNLGLGLDPSVLMVGVGALIGLRSSASMLGGAVVGWLMLAPWLLERGWVSVSGVPADAMWFTPLTNWMLWPGVALMVASALTGFVLTLPRVLRRERVKSKESQQADSTELPRRWFWGGLLLIAVAVVSLQMSLFAIDWFSAAAAVGLSFALAIVAGRVAGDTGIAPIGAMGKITQLVFAVLSPGNPTSNLMAANVTGGSASQCADLLHDLKTGRLLGAWPRHQAVAQAFGVLSGALFGSAGYLLLVPDPARQLITSEWPAPAVAQWKAVAEVFTQGLSHLPYGSGTAAAIAAALGILLSIAEGRLPARALRFVPNPASVGLALVIPAYYSLSVFLGAAIFVVARRYAASWTSRFAIVVAAGLIAGESLAGVSFALQSLLLGS